MSNAFPQPVSLEEVPILDMAPLISGGDSRSLAQALRSACEGIAFFYVKNHGVSQETIDAALSASKRFFALPLETRLQVVKDRFHRGYLPLGTTHFPGRGPDLKDSYDIGVDLPLDHPDVVAGLPLHGPNQWPDLPEFREPLESYFAAVRDFGLQLLKLFACSLDLDESFFLQHYTRPTILMRLMHYPPQEQATDPTSIGATAHTDFGLVTVLYQDPLGGLEVQKPDGEWAAAPPVPGTFVVNLGQLMARWTNDVYRATPHRVVNRLGKERYSIPFFFNPNHDAQVACISTCTGPGRPAKYPVVTAGEYIANLVRINQGYQPPGESDT